ncbi:MAG: asparagine synthase-related protein [Candidatus Muiribacteriota bacterium]
MKTPGYIEKPLYYSLKNSQIIDRIPEKKTNQNPENKSGIIQLMLFGCNFFPYCIYDNIIPLISNLKLISSDKIERESSKINHEKKITREENEFFENEMEKIFNEFLKKTGKKPYILFSGGLDSTIILHKTASNHPIAGVSVYMPDQKEDVEKAFEHYEVKKVFYEYPDSERYFELLQSYKFNYPFINAGFADDFFHVKNASAINATSVITGIGADEICGDYRIVKHEEKIITFQTFMEKYSFFDKEIIFSIFNNQEVKEIWENSISNFDLESTLGRIDFVVNTFFLNNQLALIWNNSELNQNIKRISPYSTSEFFNLINKLPEDFIENNNMEKYFLRKYSSKFLKGKIWAKKSKDFNVNAEKLTSPKLKDYINHNYKKIFNQSQLDIKKISPDEQLKMSILIKLLS